MAGLFDYELVKCPKCESVELTEEPSYALEIKKRIDGSTAYNSIQNKLIIKCKKCGEHIGEKHYPSTYYINDDIVLYKK